jgi:hypothetical protein
MRDRLALLTALVISTTCFADSTTGMRNSKVALSLNTTATSVRPQRPNAGTWWQGAMLLSQQGSLMHLFPAEIKSFASIGSGGKVLIDQNTTNSGGYNSGNVTLKNPSLSKFEVLPVSCSVTPVDDEMYPYNMQAQFKINTDPVNVQNLGNFTAFYSFCDAEASGGDCSLTNETAVYNENTITIYTYCSSACTIKVGDLNMDYYDGFDGEDNFLLGAGKKCVMGTWSDI